jgi:lysozyme family protein
MSTGFQRALERTARIEGGWSNHPVDRGGKTKYGVTEGTWKEYCARFLNGVEPYPIEDITKTDSEQVFYHLYWNPAGLDRMEREGVPQSVLNFVFDACVNHGFHTGCKLLQRAYNVVRYDQDAPLKEDGLIGSKTVDAVRRFVNKPENLSALLNSYTVERGIFFKAIVAKDSRQRTFIRGWYRRLV